MKIKDFIPVLQSLIENDKLEEAAKELNKFCNSQPEEVEKQRYDYVKEQTVHLTGRLSKLNSDNMSGRFSPEEINRTRNDVRASMLYLVRILNNTEPVPDQVHQSGFLKWVTKVGKVAVVFYVIFFVAVLSGVIFVFNLVQDKWNDMDHPKMIVSHPPDCIITIKNPVTNLHATPTKWNDVIGNIPINSYKVEEVRKVEDGPEAGRFYKIIVAEKNWTGWVYGNPLVELNPACYAEPPAISK